MVDCSIYRRRIAPMDDYEKEAIYMLAYTLVYFN